MYWTRAFQQPSSRLCNRTRNYLRSFSITASHGFLTKASPSTTPLVSLHVVKPRKTVFVSSRSLATSAGVEQGTTLEEIREGVLWGPTPKRSYSPWYSNLRRALNRIESSTVSIRLPSVEGQSTGTIITTDGYIATSTHLFSSIKSSDLPKTQVKVFFKRDKYEYEDAEVVFVDNSHSLAILKIKTGSYGVLKVPTLRLAGHCSIASSFLLYVATNSKNYMAKTYQLHDSTCDLDLHKNCFKLSPDDDEIYIGDCVPPEEFRKNYGGPLVDDAGRVVGMLTSTKSGFEYAIPTRLLLDIFWSFFKNKKNEELYGSSVSSSTQGEDKVVESSMTLTKKDGSTMEDQIKAESSSESEASSNHESGEVSGSKDIDTSSIDNGVVNNEDKNGNNRKTYDMADIVPALISYVDVMEKHCRQSSMQSKAPKVEVINKIHDMVRHQAQGMELDEVTRSELVAVLTEITRVKEGMEKRYEAHKLAEVDEFVEWMNEMYEEITTDERDFVEWYSKNLQAFRRLRTRVCEVRSQLSSLKGPKKE